MAFSISEFSAEVNKRGLAQNNLFFVTITLPQVISVLHDDMPSRDLTFMCRSVDLPSLDVGTAQVRQQGYGLAEHRPTNFGFDNLQTVFMVDGDFGVTKFFHRWIQEIVNFDTSGGIVSEVNGKLPFEFGYKDDVAATITVHVYSTAAQTVEYTYEFGKAWPISVPGTQVAWENSAEIMTQPVGFTYSSLKVSGAKTGNANDDLSRGNGLLTYLSSLNSYGQAISQISRPTSVQDAINEITNVSTILKSL